MGGYATIKKLSKSGVLCGKWAWSGANIGCHTEGFHVSWRHLLSREDLSYDVSRFWSHWNRRGCSQCRRRVWCLWPRWPSPPPDPLQQRQWPRKSYSPANSIFKKSDDPVQPGCEEQAFFMRLLCPTHIRWTFATSATSALSELLQNLCFFFCVFFHFWFL